MLKASHLFALVVAVVALVCGGRTVFGREEGGGSQIDQVLLKHVRLSLIAQYKLWNRSDFKYSRVFAQCPSTSHEKRSGDRIWTGTATSRPNGVLTGLGSSVSGTESYWDGSRAYSRGGPWRNVVIDANKEDASVIGPRPFEQVLGCSYLMCLFGFGESKSGFADKLTVKSLARLPEQGGRYVVLVVADDNSYAGTFEAKLDSTRSFLPVWFRFTPKRGRLFYELAHIEYVTMDSDGVPVFLPASYNLTGANPESYRLDLASVRLGSEVDETKPWFTIWPSEDVYDGIAGKSTYSKDPKWDPTGRVGFPFDQVYASIKVMPAATSDPNASTAGSTALPQPAPQPESRMTDGSARAARWLLIAGVVGLVGVVIYELRKRLAAT